MYVLVYTTVVAYHYVAMGLSYGGNALSRRVCDVIYMPGNNHLFQRVLYVLKYRVP